MSPSCLIIMLKLGATYQDWPYFKTLLWDLVRIALDLTKFLKRHPFRMFSQLGLEFLPKERLISYSCLYEVPMSLRITWALKCLGSRPTLELKACLKPRHFNTCPVFKRFLVIWSVVIWLLPSVGTWLSSKRTNLTNVTFAISRLQGLCHF